MMTDFLKRQLGFLVLVLVVVQVFALGYGGAPTAVEPAAGSAAAGQAADNAGSTTGDETESETTDDAEGRAAGEGSDAAGGTVESGVGADSAVEEQATVPVRAPSAGLGQTFLAREVCRLLGVVAEPSTASVGAVGGLGLGSVLPWQLTVPTEEAEPEDVLIFNYAAGDESAFFWNKDAGKQTDLPIKVAIYSTHSAETYVPFAGAAKVSGSRGGVYVASSVVAETLATEGIGVVVDDTIHDSPDWSKSYSNSMQTASRLLNQNPELEVLIDMHRDAGVSKESSTVTVDGKSAAKIMLVVGSAARLDHPNWQQNLAFATKIGERMEAMYPGLLRTVKVQDGRYNQHLSSKAILVEMGATENTIEEVEYAATMLANVLADVIDASE